MKNFRMPPLWSSTADVGEQSGRGSRLKAGSSAARPGAPAGCIVSLHGDMICSRFRRNNALDSVSDLDKSNMRAQGETAR